VRTVLVIIAIVGLESGWEVVAWRAWRLREHYLQRIAGLISISGYYENELKRTQEALANLEKDKGLYGAQLMYTEAAKEAIFAQKRDRLRREMSVAATLDSIYGELLRKYQAAAADPLRTISPDPPMPFRPMEPDLYIWDWRTLTDANRALAGFDEIIESYPDHPEAQHGRAWILATCPYAALRNGKLAVAAATRACELSNWNEAQFISTLAAAYAEVGDFASAVRWEEKARELAVRSRGLGLWGEERIKSYKMGKPFRTTR
jgi:tetratricopeptide (TPR) repeat protein